MNSRVLELVIAVVSLIALSSIFFYYSQPHVVGNEQILNEINRLLLPVDARSITEEDFSTLKGLVKKDRYATSEVRELQILAHYKEYTHVGHGLGELYRYVQTGEDDVCAGHLIAHYYVFMRHNETLIAEENLNEARDEIKDPSQSLAQQALDRIDEGNTAASDDEISALVNEPCSR